LDSTRWSVKGRLLKPHLRLTLPADVIKFFQCRIQSYIFCIYNDNASVVVGLSVFALG
jgi:hypothetical protein